MAIIHSLKCTVPFSYVVPLLSLVITRCIIRCHSLSLVVPLAVTRSRSLSFVVNRYHSLYHSLSFLVTCCTTLCHSLSLVVTRCTTRLSFYKRSIFVAAFSGYSFKWLLLLTATPFAMWCNSV